MATLSTPEQTNRCLFCINGGWYFGNVSNLSLFWEYRSELTLREYADGEWKCHKLAANSSAASLAMTEKYKITYLSTVDPAAITTIMLSAKEASNVQIRIKMRR